MLLITTFNDVFLCIAMRRNVYTTHYLERALAVGHCIAQGWLG